MNQRNFDEALRPLMITNSLHSKQTSRERGYGTPEIPFSPAANDSGWLALLPIRNTFLTDAAIGRDVLRFGNTAG